jgi:hypothetical protein
MTIKFHHPPTASSNPLKDFEPRDQTQYPDKGVEGVYIYGIRAKIDGDLKFVPLVVGEGNLRKRLFNHHYHGKFSKPLSNLLGHGATKSGDPKELWDFSRTDLSTTELTLIYSDIKTYDSLLGTRGQTAQGVNIKTGKVAGLSKLLFFQDSHFFDMRHSVRPIMPSRNFKIESSIQYLLSKGNTANIVEHVLRIVTTLQRFTEQFYYVYAVIPNQIALRHLTTKEVLTSIERSVKDHLMTDSLYTTGGVRPNKLSGQITVDLSQVQEELPKIRWLNNLVKP